VLYTTDKQTDRQAIAYSECEGHIFVLQINLHSCLVIKKCVITHKVSFVVVISYSSPSIWGCVFFFCYADTSRWARKWRWHDW